MSVYKAGKLVRTVYREVIRLAVATSTERGDAPVTD